MVNPNKQKLRHSKIRNTGILFELLTRQMTTDTLQNKESAAAGILRKYFNDNEVLKEFKIYHTLSTSKNLSEAKSMMLIESCLNAYKKLNKNNLRKQKYNLISDIKEHYDIDEFFKTKVDNYKLLASIFMLFESSAAESIDEKVDASYKFTILESISAKIDEGKKDMFEEFSSFDKGTRLLVYKTLVEKFNEKYKEFSDKQRKLLREYINNVSTSDKLRDYVNAEVAAVKTKLQEISNNIADDARKLKIKEISGYINLIENGKIVTDKDVQNLLYSYELISEYESK